MANEPENLISAYLDNQLSVEERARFEERLRQDEQLRALTHQLELQSRELRALPKFSLDTGFADRVVNDARLDSVFANASSRQHEAPTRAASRKFSEYSVEQSKWKYALGAIASLAALLLLSAFLVFPKMYEALSVAENATAEAAEPHTESGDIDDLMDPVNPSPDPTDTVRGRKSDSGSLEENETAAVQDKLSVNAGMDSNSSIDDSIKARVPSESADHERRQVAGGARKMVSGSGNALKSRSGVARSAEPFKQETAKRKNTMGELSDKPIYSFNSNEADTLRQPEDEASSDEEADENPVSQPLFGAENGEIIEVVFSDKDQEFLAFKKSLVQNSIALVPARRSSPESRKKSNDAVIAGGGVESQKSLGMPAAKPLQVFLVEATEQQLQNLLLDLNKLATVKNLRQPMGAAEIVKDAWNSEKADSGIADGRTQDRFDNPTMSANAREMDLVTALRLAKLGQKTNQVQNQPSKPSEPKQFNKQTAPFGNREALRKLVFVLQNALPDNSRVAPPTEAREK